MKRPPHTFVVEVRRQRRSANSNGKAWLTEPALAGALAGSGRHAGAAALFEAEPKAPLAEAPPARPQGRILPSLADVEPIASRFEEAAASPRRKREGIAVTGKLKTRRKKDPGRQIAPPVRSSEASFEETRAVGPSAPTPSERPRRLRRARKPNAKSPRPSPSRSARSPPPRPPPSPKPRRRTRPPSAPARAKPGIVASWTATFSAPNSSRGNVGSGDCKRRGDRGNFRAQS